MLRNITAAAIFSLVLMIQFPAQSAPAPDAAPTDPSFPVTLQASDGQSIRQVCEIARQSAGINLETAQAVTTYCTGLLTKIGTAATAAANHPAYKK
jgi:hypothetical protein